MKALISNLRNNNFLSRIFHTIEFCVKDELKDCKSVLDIGCGPSSIIQNFPNIKYSVGVEIFEPYLKASKKNKIHTEYIKGKIQDLEFDKKSFDAVIMIEVLEHMSKADGIKVMKTIEKWAKKKIIITTPNGYFPMGEVDKNSYQKHISGWTIEEFKKKGYVCNGVTGAKIMYTNENHVHSLDEGFGFTNMRFKPQSLSFVINAFLQIFVYYFPKYAFEIIAVKKF